MFTKYKFFIFTENPERLVKFYTDILGFEITLELKLPKDYGYRLKVSDGYEIWIERHSKVRGYNKDPYRHILTLYTDSVQNVYEKVNEVEDVKIIQEPICMSEFNPEEKRYVCTVLDPERNCLQFIGDL